MARKVVPGVKYTRGELKKLMDQASADDLRIKGYILRYDGKHFTVVHHTKAAGTIGESVGTFAPPPPIQKRTEQQRLDSMMLTLVDEMKKAGGLASLQTGVAPRITLEDGTTRPPTTAEIDAAKRRQVEERELLDRHVRDIVGEAWKQGRLDVTGDVVRQVVSGLLTRSEREHEEKLSKQITRHED